MVQDIFTFEKLPSRILPGFGGAPRLQGFVAVRIYDDELHAVIQKIVKGLAYGLEGVLLDGGYLLHYFPLEGTGHPEVERFLVTSGTLYDWGPGLHVRRVAAADISLTKIEIWERLRFYAAVERIVEANA